MDNSKNTKELFRIVNNLRIQHSQSTSTRQDDWRNSWKFCWILLKLDNQNMTIFHRHPTIPSRKNKYTKNLQVLQPLTHDKVKREIMGMKNKSCKFDQISTPMLKETIATCLLTITNTVNMSLTRGDFITDWKLTLVRTLHKNMDLNLYTRTTDLSQTYPSSPSLFSDACYNSYWTHCYPTKSHNRLPICLP